MWSYVVFLHITTLTGRNFPHARPRVLGKLGMWGRLEIVRNLSGGEARSRRPCVFPSLPLA